MDIYLSIDQPINHQYLTISGSKSESNRLLLMQALYPGLSIKNLSDADDAKAMTKALSSLSATIDVHHAGTAMRFLTAYFATQTGKKTTLTGSDRMKERPIAVLVDALQQLGADIVYQEKNGYPPIQICGKKLVKNEVSIAANVSSQYISALMMIASTLPHGLQIKLKGEITSMPYILMTLHILKQLGIQAGIDGQTISIAPTKQLTSRNFMVESDWSSASYYYSIVALSPIGTKITLSFFKKDSLQGDAALSKIYTELGVVTRFEQNRIVLEKTNNPQTKSIQLSLNHTPDIAQTLIVSCLGLGLTCTLTGLHTLKIKETDRLLALQNELRKFGATVDCTDDTIALTNAINFSENIISINTYQDHRMAMAFAPLAIKQNLCIKNADVVSKSYPRFWDDLQRIGFTVKHK